MQALAHLVRVLAGTSVLLLGAPLAASAYLSRIDSTPFPRSSSIIGAQWSSQAHPPPSNQFGDVLPTVWADDGSVYTLMDDGGTGVPLKGGLWRQSLARITGTPPRLSFQHVGHALAPPPHTWAQIAADRSIWRGPLGPYYSSGLLAVDHVFYATQELDWDWSANGPFTGLAGIAYSTDRGVDWTFPARAFPAPLGNLNWVARGQDGAHTDGFVYAVATEREFNASRLIMGRTRPSVAAITDPAQWQWVSGWRAEGGGTTPVWSSMPAAAVPIASWASHITYPQMSYDAPLHRYLLSFSFSYSSLPPAVWTGGAELVILDAPRPWGPFTFVAGETDFGPSNGYDPGIPVKWISADGRDLWLKWAANWDGCAPGLRCSGRYGFNFRRLHLTVAGDRPATPAKRPNPRITAH